MAQTEKSSFKEQLEMALAQPDNFSNLISDKLNPLTEEKLTEMLRVLAEGGVVSKQLVSKLFVEKGDEAAAFLTKKIDENKPALFVEIANILAELQYEEAIDVLANSLNGKNNELVLSAVKALSKMKVGKKVDDYLVNFYLNYADEVKLFSSIRFLLSRQKTLVHEFLEKYRGLSADRRMWVLKFLAETGNPEALHLFAEELEAAPLECGLYCIAGLGKIPSEEAAKVLVQHLRSSEWFLRKRIVEALGQTGQTLAVEALLGMLEDESVQVRAATVESLTKVGNLKPELLIQKLKSSNGDVKTNLIRAMGQLKNEAFVEPLIEELKDRRNLFFTVDALGDLGNQKAEMPLKRLLNDKEWFNRLNALEALAKLQVDSLMQVAQQASKDENDMVRNSAARLIATKQSAIGQ
jgi:HEAT repeat protein